MIEEFHMQEIPRKESLINQLEVILASCKGEKINLCYAMYKLIEQASPEDVSELLQFAAEIFDVTESCEKIFAEAFINENEESYLKSRYGNLADEMLKTLISDNPIKADFYKGVWDIVNNPFFKDEKARVFAFYYIFIDSRIPYFHLDQGLKMSNEDFQLHVKKLVKKKAKIRFIIVREFPQKTEEASLLLQEIDSEESLEDRTILMSCLISEFRRREKLLKDQIQYYKS